MKVDAYYQVEPMWGYAVAILVDDKLNTFYTAGNHVGDSQIYQAEPSSRVSRAELTSFAKGTLREFLDEKFPGSNVKIRRSNDLILIEKIDGEKFYLPYYEVTD